MVGQMILRLGMMVELLLLRLGKGVEPPMVVQTMLVRLLPRLGVEPLLQLILRLGKWRRGDAIWVLAPKIQS